MSSDLNGINNADAQPVLRVFDGEPLRPCFVAIQSQGVCFIDIRQGGDVVPEIEAAMQFRHRRNIEAMSKYATLVRKQIPSSALRASLARPPANRWDASSIKR